MGEAPAWAEAVASRLAFFARGRPGARRERRALRRLLRDLRRRAAAPGGPEAALAAFCGACLALAEAAVAARPDLAGFRAAFAHLCGLARAELASACDDRPLLAAVAALPDPVPWPAAQVPGRVVFLAAMAAQVPDAEAEAAVMLVNDLVALGRDLPGAALAAASA
jgi:hypothetical protein